MSARVGAKYCSSACRFRAKYLRDLLSHLDPAIYRFFLRLLRFSPPDAAGYRVGFDDPGPLWFYPPADRYSKRWRGRSVRRGYFRLVPFEPPLVPQPARYGIRFVNTRGEILRPPHGATSGGGSRADSADPDRRWRTLIRASSI
jgi:hypothetical protein